VTLQKFSSAGNGAAPLASPPHWESEYSLPRRTYPPFPSTFDRLPPTEPLTTFWPFEALQASTARRTSLLRCVRTLTVRTHARKRHLNGHSRTGAKCRTFQRPHLTSLNSFHDQLARSVLL